MLFRVCLGRLAGLNAVEIALKDEDGSNLIDNGAMAGSGAAGGVEMAMGFGGRKALIPEVNLQASLIAKDLSESLGFGSLRAEVSGHVQGVADDDGAASVAPDESLDGMEIIPPTGANEGHDGLGSETELVRDSDPDAAITDVEPHQPARCNGCLSVIVRSHRWMVLG